MSSSRRAVTHLAAALIALACAGVATLPSAGASPRPTLRSQLAQAQSRQGSLAASVSGLDGLIAGLSAQIAIVQRREADVRSTLSADEAALRVSRGRLAAQRQAARRAAHRLGWARALLARQLVSGYETGQPDLITVLLNARGFGQLLEQVGFLQMAERQQGTIIGSTRLARARALAAARSLAVTTRRNLQLTDGARLQARALAGMDGLLQGKEATLAQARAVQSQALGATQAQVRGLQSRIARVQAEQAAAARAAAARAAAAAASTGPAPASALGSGAGWAIPYAVVMCESGGQNLPPNGAGASGYYQILPSTWTGEGGSGPAAYLAPKAEQDAVAARLWNSGAGASNWVCAGIVGIH